MILGQFAGGPAVRTDYNQTDPSKADYLVGRESIAKHLANENNPHDVTAEQVGALPITGGTLTGALNAGEKVRIWTDTEGGNVRIVPSESGKTYTNYWEIDSYDGGLRFYANRPSTNPNGAGVIQTLILGTSGEIKVGNAAKTRENLGVAPATQSTASANCYYRTVDGVTEWINPPMSLGTEYRTTERWNGKPVYVKAFYFSALGAAYSSVGAAITSGTITIVSLEGVAENNGTEKYPFPLIRHDTNGVVIGRLISYVTDGTHHLYVRSFADNLTAWKARVIVKYTKG